MTDESLGSQTACGDAAAGKLSVVGQAMSGPEIYAERCAWRVLHAASRTASGGDSFFVVQVNDRAFAFAPVTLHFFLVLMKTSLT